MCCAFLQPERFAIAILALVYCVIFSVGILQRLSPAQHVPYHSRTFIVYFKEIVSLFPLP